MYLLGKITVTSILPEKLARLKDIAYNLWWSWNSEALDLFREIDPVLWDKVHGNPVKMLNEVSSRVINEKLNDEGFMKRYAMVVDKFDAYMNNTQTWYNENFPDKKESMVAYFSAEFGLNEVLPIYSGGLGVLSGDHCKSASDLGIPFAAIGLFYKQGYFNQHINAAGWQETTYPELNTSQLPITPALDSNGNEVYINVEMAGRIVYAKVWRIQAGRIPLYLMDTDVERNSEFDRHITARLYGGDQETRIQQEILLGIGGIKLLNTLGIVPAVYHMNEGHSAFVGLELMRILIQEKGLTFKAAREVVSSSLVFTTHTPVPAGNDVFPLHMIDKYFGNYWSSLGISRHEFLDLGLKIGDSHNFNMTVLALTLSGRKNGVSELHGAVTRNMFSNLWSGVPEEEIPVSHITNGIHTLTWLSPQFKKLYDQYLDKGWEDKVYREETWRRVDNIPSQELWEAHCIMKDKMIRYIRKALQKQRIQNGEPAECIRESAAALDPEALTIGFARRFATYKRANLIFRNIERIKKLLNNPKMPVQIIFAGKAHPADRPAHEVIKSINDITKQEGFNGKVVLVEDYNMELARNLVQGVDIWLNNPRRPLEASGTSGQKVCPNGIINFSILDGWWCEGYNGKNGWAIGDNTYYDNEYFQDNADSDSLYEILEQEIIPLYYDRNSDGIPEKWISLMKESIKSVSWQFNTHRMVQEYTIKMYLPSMERMNRILSAQYDMARNLSDWKSRIEANWPQIKIISDMSSCRFRELKTQAGEPVDISASVFLGSIKPSDVKIQIYYGILGENNSIDNPLSKDMKLDESLGADTYKYSAGLIIPEGGEYGFTLRIVPDHPDMINPFEMGRVKWAVQEHY